MRLKALPVLTLAALVWLGVSDLLPSPALAGGFPVTMNSSGELDLSELKARLAELVASADKREEGKEIKEFGRLFLKRMPDRYRWNISLEGGRLYVKLMNRVPAEGLDKQARAYFERGGAMLDLRHRLAVERTLFSLSVGDPLGLGKVFLEALASLKLTDELEKNPSAPLGELFKMLPPDLNLSPDSPQIQTIFETLEQAVGDELDLVIFPTSLPTTSGLPVGFGLMLKLSDPSLLEGILALAIPPQIQQGGPHREKGFTVYPLSLEESQLAIGLSDQWVFLTNDEQGMLSLIRSRPILSGVPPQRLFYRGQLNLKLIRQVVGKDFDRDLLPQSGPLGSRLFGLRKLLDFAPENLDRVYFTVGREGDWQVTTIDADADLISLVMLLMAKQAQSQAPQQQVELPPPLGYETAVSSANADLIAEALAGYLEDHGRLPRHLDLLVEQNYLESLPLNPYTDQPLREVGPGEFSPGDVVYLVYAGGKKAELLFFGGDPQGGLDVFTSSGKNRFAGYPSPIGSDGSPDGVVVWISIEP